MKTSLCSMIVLCLTIPLLAADADRTRPARNEYSAPQNLPRFERLLGFLKTHAPETPADLPPLVAGIAPHASYYDAGRAYYPLFERISAPEVVIFGVTHRTTREKLGQFENKLIFDSYARWIGPYGDIKTSPLRECLKKCLDPQYTMVSNKAHQLDHSIENLLPFLQHARRDVRITPIMITPMSFETMDALSAKVADVVDAYMRENRLEPGKDIFFLISADANHYGKDFNNLHFGEGQAAYDKGIAHDRKLVKTYIDGPVTRERLRDLSAQLSGKDFKSYGSVVWCGHYTIPFGLLTVNHLVEKRFPDRRLAGKAFYYTDSLGEKVRPPAEPGEDTIPSSLAHWVGFFSAGYYLQESPPKGK
jgi:MEMO1 family protein